MVNGTRRKSRRSLAPLYPSEYNRSRTRSRRPTSGSLKPRSPVAAAASVNTSTGMTAEENEFFVSVSMMSEADRTDLYKMLKREHGSDARRKRRIFRAAVRAARKMRASSH